MGFIRDQRMLEFQLTPLRFYLGANSGLDVVTGPPDPYIVYPKLDVELW